MGKWTTIQTIMFDEKQNIDKCQITRICISDVSTKKKPGKQDWEVESDSMKWSWEVKSSKTRDEKRNKRCISVDKPTDDNPFWTITTRKSGKRYFRLDPETRKYRYQERMCAFYKLMWWLKEDLSPPKVAKNDDGSVGATPKKAGDLTSSTSKNVERFANGAGTACEIASKISWFGWLGELWK